MRLRITTPLSVVIDENDIEVVRAEDASGSFGIQAGHADFLTSLAVGAVSWKSHDGAQHFCAVRGGVLTVTGGQEVAIATREAIPGDDLARLDQVIQERFHADAEAERADHAATAKLQVTAIRQIVRHLRPSGGAGMMS